MSAQALAPALDRVQAALQRHPSTGLHDDAPATAQWEGGTRMNVHHSDGHQVCTDMPTALGGGGTAVTPGWLFRAGLASCAATSVAMAAARSGIALQSLAVQAGSRSDTRGLLGLPDTDDRHVSAAPQGLCLHVRVSADGVAADRLRELVASAIDASPIPCAAQEALALDLRIDIDVGSG